MTSLPRMHGASVLDGVDPRARILAAVALCIALSVASRFTTLGLALLGVVVLVRLAGIAFRSLARRVATLNCFMLVVAILVPLSAGGPALAAFGPFQVSQEGMRLAGLIVLKGNAIVLGLMALLGTLDGIVLGHALHHLRVPEKLIHLMLFTLRYLEVLRRESERLRAAMKVRAFRPRMSWHTYQAYGYLVGMLLVRSLDRAERIVSAMKCRGFRGRFYLLDHFAFSPCDAWFAMATAIALALLAVVEYA